MQLLLLASARRSPTRAGKAHLTPVTLSLTDDDDLITLQSFVYDVAQPPDYVANQKFIDELVNEHMRFSRKKVRWHQ